ncbi:hypothetical protein SARC_13443, partial [Sphaeroforma arctica JP610]
LAEAARNAKLYEDPIATQTIEHIRTVLKDGVELKSQLHELKRATIYLSSAANGLKCTTECTDTDASVSEEWWLCVCDVLTEMHLATLSSALHLCILGVLNGLNDYTCAVGGDTTERKNRVPARIGNKSLAALRSRSCSASVGDSLLSLIVARNDSVARDSLELIHHDSVESFGVKLAQWCSQISNQQTASDMRDINEPESATKQSLVQSMMRFISAVDESLYSTPTPSHTQPTNTEQSVRASESQAVKYRQWIRVCTQVANACLALLVDSRDSSDVQFHLSVAELMSVCLGVICHDTSELAHVVNYIMYGKEITPDSLLSPKLVLPASIAGGICSSQLCETDEMQLILLTIVSGLLQKVPRDALWLPALRDTTMSAIITTQADGDTARIESDSTPTNRDIRTQCILNRRVLDGDLQPLYAGLLPTIMAFADRNPVAQDNTNDVSYLDCRTML